MSNVCSGGESFDEPSGTHTDPRRPVVDCDDRGGSRTRFRGFRGRTPLSAGRRAVMNLLGAAAVTLICTMTLSGCSQSLHQSAYVSQPAPVSHVLLVPELRGGWAGWCVATGYRPAMEGGAGCGESTTTSTGPIFDEAGCTEGQTRIEIYALTTSEVAAVSVYGGRPIPTFTNATLPDGLRAVSVEVLRRNGHPNIDGGGALCPRLTPLDAQDRPILKNGMPGRPQTVRLPGTLHWEVPAHPPKGDCGLTATRLPKETMAIEGDVATRVGQIRPYRGLIGRALLSCVSMVYVYHQKHHLTSAVLLNQSHPGATPPPLPAMRPLAGHPGIFGAPGSEGEIVARRIPGAWLVVEEENHIGLSVPVELLEDLRAKIRSSVP